KAPRPFGMGPSPRAFARAIAAPLQSVTLQSTQPMLVHVDGKTVDGQCLEARTVPSDAKSVIDQYFDAPDAFRTTFTEKRLQRLLDETGLVAYMNPVFGFRFLAPKNYKCVTTATNGPDGIVV